MLKRNNITVAYFASAVHHMRRLIWRQSRYIFSSLDSRWSRKLPWLQLRHAINLHKVIDSKLLLFMFDHNYHGLTIIFTRHYVVRWWWPWSCPPQGSPQPPASTRPSMVATGSESPQHHQSPPSVCHISFFSTTVIIKVNVIDQDILITTYSFDSLQAFVGGERGDVQRGNCW